ncbi:H/ACA ribonucleoprotein complex non-core subunit naf1 [Plakobranchus ocellatus]|uniref:H/ACA ribonucleoprotein complex non-core subunit NAF1 n=1 Tax=Plakobranchus ocellatus TaxID=259542 RepID=A0AAV4CJP7_9GAST|nr:H/ACA ribonucleoprotein complex non-core subunit naf1 [Plakobranchus ocellatus]
MCDNKHLDDSVMDIAGNNGFDSISIGSVQTETINHNEGSNENQVRENLTEKELISSTVNSVSVESQAFPPSISDKTDHVAENINNCTHSHTKLIAKAIGEETHDTSQSHTISLLESTQLSVSLPGSIPSQTNSCATSLNCPPSQSLHHASTKISNVVLTQIKSDVPSQISNESTTQISHDNPTQVSHDASTQISHKAPDQTSQDAPIKMVHDVSDQPEDAPLHISDNAPAQTSQDTLIKMVHDESDKPEDASLHISDNASAQTSQDAPIKMVHDMSDQPEEAPLHISDNAPAQTSQDAPIKMMHDVSDQPEDAPLHISDNAPTQISQYIPSGMSPDVSDNPVVLHSSLSEKDVSTAEKHSLNCHELPTDADMDENISLENPPVQTVSESDYATPTPATINNVVVEMLEIKQEPPDEVYGQVELLHRGGPLVVYSSDDADDSDNNSKRSSCSSSSWSPPAIIDAKEELDDVISDEEVEKKLTSTKLAMSKNRSRTEGEIFPEELPPLEYLMISPDESVELEPLGVISGIVDILIVVRADDKSPALYDDTILFVEGRKPLGLIFETFGTVEKPYYSVRFNSVADITKKNFQVGQRVYFAPKADNLTKYVFIAELRKVKCDDASWKNDNEVPAVHRDYSDDEEERREKRRAKNKERGITDDGSKENLVQRKRKKRRPGQEAEDLPGPSKPGLLSGDLMRNPFGTQGQRFKAPPPGQWPPPQQTNMDNSRGQINTSNVTGPRVRGQFSTPPPPAPGGRAFHTPPPPPNTASFGQSPSWNCGQTATGIPQLSPLPASTAQSFNMPPPFPPLHPSGSPSPVSGRAPFSTSLPPPPVFHKKQPFASPPLPTFSSPCHPAFPNSNRPLPPVANVSVRPPGPPSSFPPSWSPNCPPPFPPCPINSYGLRPSNFNPAVPPPPPPVGSNCSAQTFPVFGSTPPPLANNKNQQ